MPAHADGGNGGGDAGGSPGGGSDPGPDAVSPDDWRETERWLDEWTQRSPEPDAPAPEATLRPTRPPIARPTGPTSPPRASPSPWPPACGLGVRAPAVARVRAGRPADPAVHPVDPAAPTCGADDRHRRRPPAPPPPPPDAGLRVAPVSRGRQRVGQLLFAGLALAVAALASITLLMLDGDDGPDPVTLGEVSAAEPGATVRTGRGVAAARGRRGDRGRRRRPGGRRRAAVTVDLEGGGVVRFDTGASVTFIDEAIDAETGERDGDSEPALQILAGRAWVNPADGTTIEVRLPGGRATTVANPGGHRVPWRLHPARPGGRGRHRQRRRSRRRTDPDRARDPAGRRHA